MKRACEGQALLRCLWQGTAGHPLRWSALVVVFHSVLSTCSFPPFPGHSVAPGAVTAPSPGLEELPARSRRTDCGHTAFKRLFALHVSSTASAAAQARPVWGSGHSFPSCRRLPREPATVRRMAQNIFNRMTRFFRTLYAKSFLGPGEAHQKNVTALLEVWCFWSAGLSVAHVTSVGVWPQRLPLLGTSPLCACCFAFSPVGWHFLPSSPSS